MHFSVTTLPNVSFFENKPKLIPPALVLFHIRINILKEIQSIY